MNSPTSKQGRRSRSQSPIRPSKEDSRIWRYRETLPRSFGHGSTHGSPSVRTSQSGSFRLEFPSISSHQAGEEFNFDPEGPNGCDFAPMLTTTEQAPLVDDSMHDGLYEPMSLDLNDSKRESIDDLTSLDLNELQPDSIFDPMLLDLNDSEPSLRFRWANVECAIQWNNGTYCPCLIIGSSIRANTGEGFQGRDVISLFSKIGSVQERFAGIFSWNNRIQVPMQRYHLPFIGYILSPGDQGLSFFFDIPPSGPVIEIITKFLFESSIFMSPPLGLTSPDLRMTVSDPETSEIHNIPSAGELRSRMGDEIFEVLDFALTCTLISHWFGFSPRGFILDKTKLVPALDNQAIAGVHLSYASTRQQYIDAKKAVITAPYNVFPRRLWDLRVNRVIPFYLLQLPWTVGVVPDYVAISHSWVEETELAYDYTPVNQWSWAVPLPKGTDLELIRNEVLGYFPSIRYCWLDVLCLRQTAHPNDRTIPSSLQRSLLEALELGPGQTDELSLDVPTIGNIYKNATGVLRYFNGLGRAFKTTDWHHEHHWLNRAWTLQEYNTQSVNGGLLETFINPLNTVSTWRGTHKRLREFLRDIEDTMQGFNSNRSIIALVREMDQRKASKEIDKIAGLSYLLHFEELPLYSKDEPVEDGWKRCLRSAPATILAELFFNCPLSGLFGLFPTWEELKSCPKTFVHQELPGPHSVQINGEPQVHGAEYLSEAPKEIQFFGYQLCAWITKADENGVDYKVEAHPKPHAIYHEMTMYLRFFLGHGVALALSDNIDTVYQLFTHSLRPCSSWVVIHSGKKVGVLCSDDVFFSLHHFQILEKGMVVYDRSGLMFYPMP
ncbi:hypothetical protein BDZ91DRAFT_785708 [Kalaharituber pfeilii]|nr:hypothetical protein BDZ91DRAFT_785708 [Kalaharituber pfeilii]